MTVKEIDAKAFYELFGRPDSIYDSRAFIDLNAHKTGGRTRYLLIGDENSAILGLVVGEDAQGGWRVPFSAPYATWHYKRTPHIADIDQALQALQSTGRPITITLPPTGYYPLASLTAAVATGRGIKVILDINYHLDLASWTLNGSDTASARNKYNHAVKAGLRYVALDAASDSDIARAYNVIRINREAHGYPLRMSLKEVVATCRFMPATFGVVTDGAGHDIAAAQVFYPFKGIAQVVYWGNDPLYNGLRPMNYLPVALAGHLHDDTRILDMGPASTDGVPNTGLCDYKESLGGRASVKPTLLINQ